MGREEKLKGFRQPNSPVGGGGRKGDMGWLGGGETEKSRGGGN